MQENYILGVFITHLNVVSDDLCQKIAGKLNCDYYYFLHSVSINMVLPFGIWTMNT